MGCDSMCCLGDRGTWWMRFTQTVKVISSDNKRFSRTLSIIVDASRFDEIFHHLVNLALLQVNIPNQVLKLRYRYRLAVLSALLDCQRFLEI